MLISDDNKEIVKDVEKSIRVLRKLDSALRLGQIIEKGFFIDSQSSLPLQLCDLFTLSLRKKYELQVLGKEEKSFDKSGIETAGKLVYENKAEEFDVLKWVKTHHAGLKEK